MDMALHTHCCCIGQFKLSSRVETQARREHPDLPLQQCGDSLLRFPHLNIFHRLLTASAPNSAAARCKLVSTCVTQSSHCHLARPRPYTLHNLQYVHNLRDSSKRELEILNNLLHGFDLPVAEVELPVF